jgi:hypothetical protein
MTLDAAYFTVFIFYYLAFNGASIIPVPPFNIIAL